MYGIIYRATNRYNGKVYIGQTTKPLCRRKQEHFRENSNCRLFREALNYYGINAFMWEIVGVAFSDRELNKMENSLIRSSESYKEEFGYNLDLFGVHYSCETRKKISEANRGDKHPMFGKKHKKETIEAYSEKRRGINNSFFGMHHTYESIMKNIDKQAKGVWLIITPTGEEVTTKYLKLFCREHGLVPHCMRDVSKGIYKQHHGYKCKQKENII